MTRDEVRTLFAYDRWADERFVAALEKLSPAELEREIPSSFPSPLATLVHIAGANWIWLERFQGRSPAGAVPEWYEKPTFAGTRAKLAEIAAARDAHFAGIDNAALEREIDYRTFDGTPHRSRLVDLCRHVVNHASYHRGQLTTMLRQLGAEPPATDFVLFLREGGDRDRG